MSDKLQGSIDGIEHPPRDDGRLDLSADRLAEVSRLHHASHHRDRGSDFVFILDFISTHTNLYEAGRTTAIVA